MHARTNVPSLLLALALALGTTEARGAPGTGPAAGTAVALPKPAVDGTMTLDQALATRRSIRALAGAPIPARTLSKLLWAAQGVTDGNGHRTVPSARATYPMDVIALVARVDGVAPGTYRYDPAAHALRPLAAGDRMAAFVKEACGQDWALQASVVFVVTGTPERARAKMGDRAGQFIGLEAGLAAQSLLLQVTAQGLGATFVGGFQADKAAAFLGLPPGESVQAIVPVGVRKEP